MGQTVELTQTVLRERDGHALCCFLFSRRRKMALRSVYIAGFHTHTHTPMDQLFCLSSPPSPRRIHDRDDQPKQPPQHAARVRVPGADHARADQVRSGRGPSGVPSVSVFQPRPLRLLQDGATYSIGIRYVLQTTGAEQLLSQLQTWARHQKGLNNTIRFAGGTPPPSGVLCTSWTTGGLCVRASQCAFVHAMVDGYRTRRLWKAWPPQGSVPAPVCECRPVVGVHVGSNKTHPPPRARPALPRVLMRLPERPPLHLWVPIRLPLRQRGDMAHNPYAWRALPPGFGTEDYDDDDDEERGGSTTPSPPTPPTPPPVRQPSQPV